MASPDLHKLLQHKMTRRQFLGFGVVAAASMFGIIRIISELKSHAAGLPTGFEPEDGTLGNGATKVANGTASGGDALKFGANPTPTPTPGFVLGTTKPTAANTANFADGQLPVLSAGMPNYSNGDLLITAADSGKTFSNMEIRGFVYATGSPTNVTLRGLRVVGRNTGYSGSRGVGMVCLNGFGTGLLVEQCELTCWANGQDVSRYWIGGISGTASNWTANRNNIHDVTDGMYINGGNNITLTGNYIHDNTLRTDDTDHPASSSNPFRPYWGHCDGIQTRGSDNVLIDGNSIIASFSPNTGMMKDPNAPSINGSNVSTPGNHTYDTNSQPVFWGVGNPIPRDYYPNMHCLIIQAYVSNFTNFRVNRNWLAKGQYIVQENSQAAYATGNTISWSGNRWYASDQTVNVDGGGLATQATIPAGLATGNQTLLSTVYASDDPDIPAGWRGHLVQPTSSGSTGTGNYKFNPALTPN